MLNSESAAVVNFQTRAYRYSLSVLSSIVDYAFATTFNDKLRGFGQNVNIGASSTFGLMNAAERF